MLTFYSRSSRRKIFWQTVAKHNFNLFILHQSYLKSPSGNGKIKDRRRRSNKKNIVKIIFHKSFIYNFFGEYFSASDYYFHSSAFIELRNKNKIISASQEIILALEFQNKIKKIKKRSEVKLRGA